MRRSAEGRQPSAKSPDKAGAAAVDATPYSSSSKIAADVNTKVPSPVQHLLSAISIFIPKSEPPSKATSGAADGAHKPPAGPFDAAAKSLFDDFSAPARR
jgi:hypothetical protein